MKILLKQDKPIALKYNSNRRSKKTLKSSVFEQTLNFKSVMSERFTLESAVVTNRFVFTIP
jgi:hypothetical protein